MTLDPHKLDTAVRDLHQTLDQNPKFDDSSRSKVRDAVASATADGAEHHGLEELAVGFEVEHPTLAASLRQIIDVLGKGGL